MKKLLIIFSLIGAFSLVSPTIAEAQCPMCKMAAESNLNAGGSSGQGLNNGILYMLATPYVIIGTIAFIWWRNRRKENEEELIAEEVV